MTKTAQSAALQALVDELGELEAELAPFKAKIQRLEAVRAAVRAAFASHDSGASFVAAGAKWQVILGPAKNVSVVDKPLLAKKIGLARFVELAAISVKAVESLPSNVQAAVLRLVPSGARPLTIVAANEKESAA